jgi:hypothetical protein
LLHPKNGNHQVLRLKGKKNRTRELGEVTLLGKLDFRGGYIELGQDFFYTQKKREKNACRQSFKLAL